MKQSEDLRKSDFDHSNLFQLKSKLAWLVCTKSMKIKTKMLQEQWLLLKMKFLLGYNMKTVI